MIPRPKITNKKPIFEDRVCLDAKIMTPMCLCKALTKKKTMVFTQAT